MCVLQRNPANCSRSLRHHRRQIANLLSGLLPTQVDYRDRLFASGKFPEGNPFRREPAASDPEVLSARLIDRAIRPLFPPGFVNDIHVRFSLYFKYSRCWSHQPSFPVLTMFLLDIVLP